MRRANPECGHPGDAGVRRRRGPRETQAGRARRRENRDRGYGVGCGGGGGSRTHSPLEFQPYSCRGSGRSGVSS